MDEKPLLEMLNEYFVYIEDDEGETEPPDWWNNGWYDSVGYSQEWGERLLELAKQTLEQAEAERDALVDYAKESRKAFFRLQEGWRCLPASLRERIDR